MKVGDEVYLKNNPSMKGVIHSGSGHIICVDWANGTSDTHWGSSLILASEYDKENLKESKGHPNGKPRAIRIGNYDVKKPVHLIAQKGCVSVFVETEEDAELMLKALQELLGAKK